MLVVVQPAHAWELGSSGTTTQAARLMKSRSLAGGTNPLSVTFGGTLERSNPRDVAIQLLPTLSSNGMWGSRRAAAKKVS